MLFTFIQSIRDKEAKKVKQITRFSFVLFTFTGTVHSRDRTQFKTTTSQLVIKERFRAISTIITGEIPYPSITGTLYYHKQCAILYNRQPSMILCSGIGQQTLYSNMTIPLMPLFQIYAISSCLLHLINILIIRYSGIELRYPSLLPTKKVFTQSPETSNGLLTNTVIYSRWNT